MYALVALLYSTFVSVGRCENSLIHQVAVLLIKCGAQYGVVNILCQVRFDPSWYEWLELTLKNRELMNRQAMHLFLSYFAPGGWVSLDISNICGLIPLLVLHVHWQPFRLSQF
jgi:hypothetical protein